MHTWKQWLLTSQAIAWYKLIMGRYLVTKNKLLKIEAHQLVMAMAKRNDFVDVKAAATELYPDASPSEIIATEKRVMRSDHFLSVLDKMMAPAANVISGVLSDSEASNSDKLKAASLVLGNYSKVITASTKAAQTTTEEIDMSDFIT